MNLEVWYSLSHTKIADLERLENVLDSLSYRDKIKLLFKPYKETNCPHQKAAYTLLKWAEKEYMGLDVLKKILALRDVEKDKIESFAGQLGLCTAQIRDLLNSEDYHLDLKIDFIESREFFIHQTTLMIGEDHMIDASLSPEVIKDFIDKAWTTHMKKGRTCTHESYCSDEQCQFQKERIQTVKCK